MIWLGTPSDPFMIVIAICWAVFLITWAVSALFVKRTVERSWGWARGPALLAVIAIMVAARTIPGLRQPLWSRTTGIGTLAVVVTAVGLAITLWARAALGKNWSGFIVFKEGHELIVHGPYAYVRHPIYSGLLLMVLGTSAASGRLGSFVLLAALFVLLAIKAHYEEQMMTRHFPEAYAHYRHRVKGLIPGIW